MAQQKLNKANIIDLVTVLVVVFVIAMGAIYYLHPVKSINTKLLVTFHVGDPTVSRAILSQASSDKSVFLNSVNRPLEVISVKEAEDKAGDLESLDITMRGPGYINQSGNSFFNGQRVLINQKAELHASYFASGAITKIENAN